MPSRKRSLEAVDGSSLDDNSLLTRLRSMWQFANLCQWIYTFGKAAKIDDAVDIEDIEAECMKPDSRLLADIALALLKLISSHRGLTYYNFSSYYYGSNNNGIVRHDIFDGQARKQYLAKAPELNPFGDEETPLRFQDFDVFTKIKVLQQFTQWTMIHPERIREKMDEQRDVEQTNWRIEPYGWDSEDRTYFVLDDNRIYRLTEAPPPPPPKPKKKKKPYRAGRRMSKRRRTDVDLDEQHSDNAEHEAEEIHKDDGLGGMVWECLAVTLDEVRSLLDGFRRTRDENEKVLRNQLEEHLVPILEKQEESRKRKALQRERELHNLAKMANAKRSSRIANKVEQQKQEEKEKEEIQQLREAEEARRREEHARVKREKERDFRMASREQRLREREARRIRHEDELAQLSEDSRRTDGGTGRLSERRLQAEIEKNRQALKELEDEDEDWVFDCTCGLYGQVDDGAHSVACERCNVWQHSKCLDISQEEADRPEFHFICASCRKREQEPKIKPRATIKLKVNRSGGNTNVDQSANDQPNHRTAAPASETKLPSGSTQAEASSSLPDAPLSTNGPFSSADLPIAQPMTSEASKTNTVPGPDKPASPGHTEGDPRGEVPANMNMNEEQGLPRLRTNSSTSMDSPSKNVTKAIGGEGSQPAQAPKAPESLLRTPATLTQLNGQPTVTEPALYTPDISRDIYRATHSENGNLPAQAGISPIKQSPNSSFTSLSTNKNSGAVTKITPSITLSPTPREPILTPPTKHTDPVRPPDRH